MQRNNIFLKFLASGKPIQLPHAPWLFLGVLAGFIPPKCPSTGEEREGVAWSPEMAAGMISRIRLENFMCHSSLHIELDQHVNFITGQNGSTPPKP